VIQEKGAGAGEGGGGEGGCWGGGGGRGAGPGPAAAPRRKDYAGSIISCFGASVRLTQPSSITNSMSSMRTPNRPGR